MTESAAAGSGDAVARLVESARRLGIELDAADTERWHKIAMLDFSPTVLARFRRQGELVEVRGPEGVVESALALSGSSAQSKIQAHPGDGEVDVFAPDTRAATRA